MSFTHKHSVHVRLTFRPVFFLVVEDQETSSECINNTLVVSAVVVVVIIICRLHTSVLVRLRYLFCDKKEKAARSHVGDVLHLGLAEFRESRNAALGVGAVNPEARARAAGGTRIRGPPQSERHNDAHQPPARHAETGARAQQVHPRFCDARFIEYCPHAPLVIRARLPVAGFFFFLMLLFVCLLNSFKILFTFLKCVSFLGVPCLTYILTSLERGEVLASGLQTRCAEEARREEAQLAGGADARARREGEERRRAEERQDHETRAWWILDSALRSEEKYTARTCLT